MIKINLLPHREERRKQRKRAFVALMVMSVVLGGLIVLAVGFFIASEISNQQARNDYIKKENAKLDEQIKEVATLKEEIERLKARQQAVEDLQADRNQPVYLMDELVKQIPEGVYLRSLKQEGQRVTLSGYAQSNERVSEVLRNFNNSSPWLEKPELVEIRSAMLGQGRDAKRVFDFSMNVDIKRPRDKDKAARAVPGATTVPGTAPATPAVGTPAVPAAPAASPAAPVTAPAAPAPAPVVAPKKP